MRLFFIAILLVIIPKVQCQIVLQANYADNSMFVDTIHYPLNIYNRISPVNGFNNPSTPNAKLCIVRPLGGKYSNGGADISLDTYLWDENKKEFYTDFTILKKQIDGIFDKGLSIHQIVLDNPSWAFQRDSKGNLDGDTLKVSTYGNAEPPRDFDAWAKYLKDVMRFLISNYGKQEVQKIQFGIGREIGTEGHWKGSKELFFEFYKKSENAIHEVLPKAKVGSHFLWESSKKAWGTDFVKWCKNNNAHYDFFGVSYYPFFNREDRTNFPEVYKKDFGTIKDIDEWNTNATMELHEFALIKKLSKKGNSYESPGAKYQNSFIVGLTKVLFENHIKNLFLWGNGKQYMPASNEILKLHGNLYYKNTKSGTANSTKNYVNAIFTKDNESNLYSVIAYNYCALPNSNVSENLNINATLAVPNGTIIKFRSAVYDNYDNTISWSDWENSVTKGISKNESTITFSKEIPAFSFIKYEFMVEK